MSRRLLWILAGIFIAVLIFSAATIYAQGPNDGCPFGGPFGNWENCPFHDGENGWGPGMMGRGHMVGGGYGPGMMDQNNFGPRGGRGGYGPGMMGQGNFGPGSGYGPGMMGGYWNSEPVQTVDDATAVIETYLGQWNLTGEIGDVLELDTIFYATIVEDGTPTLDLVIDKESGFIMSSGWMMRGFNVDIDLDAAATSASDYISEVLPEASLGEGTVFEHHVSFPVLQDGETVAIARVCGMSGQVMLFE